MTRPGDWFRLIAVRIFSASTMDRLIDPVLADLQAEYADAVRRGHVWKTRRVRLAGYVALLKVIAWRGRERVLGSLHDWSIDDHRALGRTVGFSIIAVVVATVLLSGWPLLHFYRTHPQQTGLVVYLIPQALPLTVPLGLMFGILYGLRARTVSWRLSGAVLIMAGVCSVASFVMQASIIPRANQAFRVSISGNPDLPKGPNELTVRELSQRIDAGDGVRLPGNGRLALTYHRMWALPVAAFLLSLFALSVAARGRSGRLIAAAAGLGGMAAYYLLFVMGQAYAQDGTLSAFLGAWLPNLGVAVLSAALLSRISLSRAQPKHV